MLRGLQRKDCSERASRNPTFEGENNLRSYTVGPRGENLLVAPKEITKLFCAKEKTYHKEQEYDASNMYSDESLCNEELLMPQMRSRKHPDSCYREGEVQNIKPFSFNNQKLELAERRINVGVRHTSLLDHPAILEHKIQVEDQRLRITSPRIDGETKYIERINFNNNREGGDSLVGELTEFLPYPFNAENIKIPRKRELHRLMHHRICNNVNPDLVIVIKDKEFFCHRMVLQCYSKYFDEINNLSDDKIITIDEKDVSKNAFAAVYSWMLALNENGLKFITRENFVEVLVATQSLQIRDLEEQCLALLDSNEVFSEGHAYQLYKQAGRFKQQGIKDLMVPRIQHFFLPFVSTQDFINLSLEDLCTFLSSSYIVVHSEMEVFMSAARWLLEDWNERKQYLSKVMNCIRFGLMNPLELVDIRKNPESPEFLKITENSTIQKYIDDGLAYSTYCTMKGGSDDIKYRCQLFGLDIPHPRNWTDTPKCYKSYNEFLNYLKQIRSNPLKVIDGPQTCQSIQKTQNYSINADDNSFEIDFGPPLHTFSDSIPSMSNLLSIGLKQKAIRDKQKNMNSNKFDLEASNNDLSLEENKFATNAAISTTSVKKKHESLKSKAATIIQAAYRGYRVRRAFGFISSQKYIPTTRTQKHEKTIFSNTTPQKVVVHKLRKSSSDIDVSTMAKAGPAPGLMYANAPTIVIFGGLNPQQKLSSFNDGRSILRLVPEQNRWEKVGFMPKGRYYHNATFLKGKIYIIGGVDPKREEQRISCISSDVWSFNPSNCEWLKETHLKTPRKNFGVTSLLGHIYVIGGQGPNDAILSSVEKYDPVLKTWEEVCPLPEPRLSPAVAKYGGTIWVAGGMGINAKHVMSEVVYSYDIRLNRWINKSPLRTGKGFSVLVSHEDKLFLVGGAEKEAEKNCSQSSATIEIFDSRNNIWETYSQMKIPRHSHTSVVLGNHLYIIGGTTTQPLKSLSEVEIYSLETKTWAQNFGNLPMILTGHASVMIPAASLVMK